jgi:hypothetical protein
MGSGGGSSRSSSSRRNRPQGDAPAGGDLTCDLSFEVELSSINVDTLASCKVGDLLTVGIHEKSVICRKRDGTIIGSIIGVEELQSLISCIILGKTYEATILDLTEFSCEVRIENS